MYIWLNYNMIIKCDSIWISNKVLYRIWNSAKVCFYPLFRFEINHVNCIIICKPFTFFDTWSTPTWFVYMLEPCYLVKFFFFFNLKRKFILWTTLQYVIYLYFNTWQKWYNCAWIFYQRWFAGTKSNTVMINLYHPI